MVLVLVLDPVVGEALPGEAGTCVEDEDSGASDASWGFDSSPSVCRIHCSMTPEDAACE